MAPLLPISARAFAHDLSTLSKRYETAKTALELAKNRHIHFLPNECNRIHNDIMALATSVTNAYDSLKNVEEPKAQRTLLQKLVVLDCQLDILKKESTFLTFAEKDAPADLYTKLESIIQTLLFIVDPANSFDEKFNRLTIQDVLTLSEESPRKIAFLLLNLHKISIEKLILQIHESHNNYQRLQNFLKEINNKIYSRKHLDFEHTPRYEKSLCIKSLAVAEKEPLEDLMEKLNKSSTKITFQKPWKLIHWCGKETACEIHGKDLTEEFGKKLPSLVTQLKTLYAKVISGKLSPAESEDLSKKISTYAAAHQLIKKRLKIRRVEIYSLPADQALKPLLQYGLQLRCMLSEAAILIDSLRKHSSEEVLASFKAVKKLAKHQKDNGAKGLVQNDAFPFISAAIHIAKQFEDENN